MLPTLNGRIQTRVFVALVVGGLWTLLITPVLPVPGTLSDAYATTFVVLDGSLPLGIPTKVSMGAQEWCGNVYEQLLFSADRLERTLHSYFDGEGDRQETMPIPVPGVDGDALPIVVRGLTGELVPPGGERTVSVLDRVLDSRFQHEPPRFRATTIRRAAASES